MGKIDTAAEYYENLLNHFQCNLAPPDGIRGTNGDDTDEIEENEESDRVRYKETLGMFLYKAPFECRGEVSGIQVA